MRAVKLYFFIIFSLASVAALHKNQHKIIGGSVTTIEAYPYVSSLLYSWNFISHWQSCGGTIINNRAILSAAHCFYGDLPNNWRIRVGSKWANGGGTVHVPNQIIMHPNFNWRTADNDIAILRSVTNFIFGNTVSPASIAGSNYNIADNQPVWAIGWGLTAVGGTWSEELRHVQIWTVNQSVCRNRYTEVDMTITDNMLCSGWLDVGGRDQCQGDSGGPLIHNNVIVGVCSFGEQCAHPRYPGVNTRVSRYTSWIQSNA